LIEVCLDGIVDIFSMLTARRCSPYTTTNELVRVDADRGAPHPKPAAHSKSSPMEKEHGCRTPIALLHTPLAAYIHIDYTAA
jgi:hypothetical protein